ncbi:MAG: formate dehydrogenase accessory sulfurtransferase FdhD [Steroidobacteraceae bacterium]|jgi:FdhD protein
MTIPDPLEPAQSAAAGTLGLRVWRAGQGGWVAADDRVAVEAPLEIQLHHPALGGEPASFGTTMRTPGDDEALAAGLLYGEGIIQHASDIDAIESGTRRPNVVNVRLRPGVMIEVTPARRFSAGSSCGVCGTTGLDAAIARAAATRILGTAQAQLPVLLRLPARMREAQTRFGTTGGIHAVALFDLSGSLLAIAEDVGRHNAFDKLVGERLLAGELPLANRIVLLSGRASFELVQKALRAGVALLAAIGAPSSLAVNLAAAAGLTLVGFLRDAHCNVYAHPERLGGFSSSASGSGCGGS